MAGKARPDHVRIAEIDEKIDFCNAKIFHYQEKIRELTKKREEILHPESKITMAQVIKRARESGMTLEEIARKLKLNL